MDYDFPKILFLSLRGELVVAGLVFVLALRSWLQDCNLAVAAAVAASVAGLESWEEEEGRDDQRHLEAWAVESVEGED